MARQSAIPVLITRPEPQATRFAAELTAALGRAVAPLCCPLMEEVALTPDRPPGPYAAVVLTSEPGVRAAVRLRDQGWALPSLAFCVGDRTAAAATAAGFAAESAAGAVQDLASLILSQPDKGPLLYLHGQDRAGDLLSLLPGRPVTEAVVYAQRALALSPEALAVIGAAGPVIVPLFSPRTARLFQQALPENTGARLVPVAMSANVAQALTGDLARAATVADRPDSHAMIAAISRVISPRVP